MNDSGVICCASFVAPKNDSKEHAVNVVSNENCFVVYCNPPVEICIKRNPSGLYAAFEDNKTGNVPSLPFPYEKPERVDFELDTSSKSIDESLNKITPLLEKAQSYKLKSAIKNLLRFYTGLGISMKVCEIGCSFAKYSPNAWTP